MIKFFRKIRQNLLSEGKTGKYLKYAIGEILLVVIGILIALQINNWNENNKDLLLERKVLNEIIIDLDISKAELENDIEGHKRDIVRAERLKNNLIKKEGVYNSIISDMQWTSRSSQFSPRTSGYENLKSIGISLISNDSLRNEIVILYELDFELTIKEGREFEKFDNPQMNLRPLVNNHFQIDNESSVTLASQNHEFKHVTNRMKIKDYTLLCNDEAYITLLQNSIYNRFQNINRYNRVISKIDNLIDFILLELN
jgi:hypothetical protein